MVSGRKVAGAIRSLVNARSLQLECGRGLYESYLVPDNDMEGGGEVCWVSGEWIKSRMHGQGICVE